MFWLKLFGTIVGAYAASRLSVVAIKWLKRGFKNLEPQDDD